MRCYEIIGSLYRVFQKSSFTRQLNGTVKSLHGLLAPYHGIKHPTLKEESKMKNPVGYFEIPVNNLDRAVDFYESVFGYQLERTLIDGHEMALFPSSDQAEGITGALVKGDSYVPTKEGSRLYFVTDNIDETLTKVLSRGGKILYPKTSIGDVGWVAEFEDVEGNCIALHSS